MIDVPWAFKVRSPKGNLKSPESKYRTMSMAEAAALPVASWLKPGGMVVAWATWPLHPKQLDVFRHGWGLTYKTGGAWAKRTKTGKLRWGPGFVLRTVCEPFAVLVLGDGPGPRGPKITNLVETLADKLLDGLARLHSQKPDEMYALVEALTPGATRADVFGRQPRKGWSVFGDEVDKFGPDGRLARRTQR